MIVKYVFPHAEIYGLANIFASARAHHFPTCDHFAIQACGYVPGTPEFTADTAAEPAYRAADPASSR